MIELVDEADGSLALQPAGERLQQLARKRGLTAPDGAMLNTSRFVKRRFGSLLTYVSSLPDKLRVVNGLIHRVEQPQLLPQPPRRLHTPPATITDLDKLSMAGLL